MKNGLIELEFLEISVIQNKQINQKDCTILIKTYLSTFSKLSMNSILRLVTVGELRSLSTMSGVVENSIRNKLQTTLNTSHLDIINESYMHNVPKGSETHFKVVVVSEKFDGLPLIKRHRLVNDILKEELKTGVHALSIIAKTQQQWDSSDKVVESSPNCRGGFGK